MPIITCRDAAFAYEGDIAVRRLSFTVERGCYLCVVGDNGSGKSTLIKGLLRLLKPVQGDVWIDLPPNQIGYLPQQTNLQKDFPASVQEVVLSGRLRGLFTGKADKADAEKNMRLLRVDTLKRHRYRTLSGGQRQRVLLARALYAAKELLILDEPMAGLDPASARELYELIQTINRETRITVVMVSHDVHGAVQNASHILHLNREQVFYGTPEDYRNSEIGAEYLENAPCYDFHTHGES